MPAKIFITASRSCEHCGCPLVFKNRRDIVRKRFCSRRCNGLYVSEHRDPSIQARFTASGNTPEAHSKKRRCGSAHPRWIVDRSKLKPIRFQFEEREFVKAVLAERDYTCVLTGVRGGPLSVHHVKPVWKFPELRFERANVVVVRREIHALFHRIYGAKWATEDDWNSFIASSEYLCRHKA